MQKETLFKNERGFVGAYLPPALIDFLRLLSVRENTSIQKILENLITEEYAKQSGNEIVNEIIHQALDAWHTSTDKTAKARGEFIKNIHIRLASKKINTHDIEKIMKAVCEEVKS